MILGVSFCLLGNLCRYDGHSAKDEFVFDSLMERVKFYEPLNQPSIKNGVGIFVKKLKEKMPNLPLEKEKRLNDAWLRENFLMQVYSYNDLKILLNNEKKISTLVKFHTSYKYLIYSKSLISYKILGKIVANEGKKDIDELYKKYEEEFLKAIATKSTLNKTYNILLHIFGYFKKHITKEEKPDILESIYDFKNRVIPLISVIKIFNIYINRFNISYLMNQKFLNPYPAKLALRSDLKAYK